MVPNFARTAALIEQSCITSDGVFHKLRNHAIYFQWQDIVAKYGVMLSTLDDPARLKHR